MSGRTLGNYRIVQLVGSGGMATVYKAYETRLRRYVALKVLAPGLAADATFVQRFLREARAAAVLAHPNIVAIYDVGETGGVYYIAMQYVQGGTLRELMTERSRLPPVRIVGIVEQVASGLDYAHRNGIIHRDVKPSNILLEEGDHVLLSDFGINRAVEGARRTEMGMVVGTPSYMSPEQAGGRATDHRHDIYGLGLVAYEMVSGRLPFEGTGGLALLYSIVHEAPAPLRGFAPDIPAAVENVIDRALAKEPAERFHSAGEMACALALAWRVSEPAVARRVQAEEEPLPLASVSADECIGRVADAEVSPPLRQAAPVDRKLASWPIVGLVFLAMVAIVLVGLRGCWTWVPAGNRPTPTTPPILVTIKRIEPSEVAAGSVVTITVSGRGFGIHPKASVLACDVSRPAERVQVLSETALLATFDLKGTSPCDAQLIVEVPDGRSAACTLRLYVAVPSAAALATPSRTATSTATLAPTPTTSPTAAPTRTGTPHASYPAPVPRRPIDGEDLSGQWTITLEWAWSETLREDEYFDIRFSQPGQPHLSVALTKATTLLFGVDRLSELLGVSHEYYWSVAVVQGDLQDGQPVWTQLGPESPAQRFLVTPGLHLPPTPTRLP